MLLLLLACPPQKSGLPDDSASPTDSDSGTTSQTDSQDSGADSEDTRPIPDARDAMARNADDCQKLQGQALSGGNSYFWGEYLGNAKDGYTGQEKFYFFANDTAKATGLKDCEFTWDSTAVKGDPGKCKECSIAITVTAIAGDTTCDPAIFEDSDFSVTYGIKLPGDGSSAWYYASSGNALGTGYGNDSGANFLTPASCRWF